VRRPRRGRGDAGAGAPAAAGRDAQDVSEYLLHADEVTVQDLTGALINALDRVARLEARSTTQPEGKTMEDESRFVRVGTRLINPALVTTISAYYTASKVPPAEDWRFMPRLLISFDHDDNFLTMTGNEAVDWWFALTGSTPWPVAACEREWREAHADDDREIRPAFGTEDGE
jgi:hypothetical protein